MRTFLTLMSLVSVCAESAASTVTYTFFDPERDETFEVYALVDGDELTGLATFNIALSGLDATPIDPENIVYTPVLGGLANIDRAFQIAGFQSTLMAGAVGTDSYRATDSQLEAVNPILGFAAVDTFIDAAQTGILNYDIDGTLIDLGFGVVGAFLGELAIPGSLAFSDEELSMLFASTAEVFDGTGGATGVVTATVSNVVVTIPEPSAIITAGLACLFHVFRRPTR